MRRHFVYISILFSFGVASCVELAGEYEHRTFSTSCEQAPHYDLFGSVPMASQTVLTPYNAYDTMHSANAVHYGFSVASASRVPSYQKNPRSMTIAELTEYFGGQQEHEIVHKDNSMLLMSDAFVTYVKQFATYSSYIEYLHEKLHKKGMLGKAVGIVCGTYSDALKTRVCTLYRELQAAYEHERITRQQQQRERLALQRLPEQHTYLFERWHAEHDAGARSEHRTAILKQRLDTSGRSASDDKIPMYTQHYVISEAFAELLGAYEIDVAMMTTVRVSSVEHQIQRELLMIGRKTAALTEQYQLKNGNLFLDTLMHGIDLGTKATHALHAVIATQAADFCWAVLDVATAAGEGIALAGYRTAAFVHHVCTQPVEFITNVVDCIMAVADMLFIINDLPDQLREQDIPHKEYYYQKIADTEQKLEMLGTHVTEQLKSMTVRDWVKHGTAFVVEGMLFHALTKFTATICSRLGPLCADLVASMEVDEALMAIADESTIPVKAIAPEMEMVNLLVETAETPIVKTGAGIAIDQCTASTEELLAALSNVNTNKICHILQGHHMWEKVAKQYKNWEQVKEILKQTIIHGGPGEYKGYPTRALKFGEEWVEVVYTKNMDNNIVISNAWVKNGNIT